MNKNRNDTLEPLDNTENIYVNKNYSSKKSAMCNKYPQHSNEKTVAKKY